ncbi:MAG: 3-hydroxyanthranilate 3,4-dioxygenase [Cyclobacteriaceae bacterium]|nr:3-hydroxyanthranilate 3,4-dioxygenase [Cyclobacteriaceae bacterium]
MAIQNPFSFKKWIDENRSLLKPPVGNRQVYVGNDDFIVMVVGGPNSRKDFHYNETEEFFYQLEGDIVLRIVEDGEIKDISIKEGDIFLLPAKVPHSPQRPANTIGLVMELNRNHGEKDGFMWFCENCNEKLYEEYLTLEDIVKQLPPIMNRFYDSEHTVCKKCGTKMTKP